MARHLMETMYHRPGDRVFHSEQDCPVGSGIPIDDREMGTGSEGQVQCEKCVTLRNQRAKAAQREEIARQARVEVDPDPDEKVW